MTQIFTAIGNACTDLVASVDDDFLEKHAIRKYHCTYLADAARLKDLKDNMPSYQAIPGGVGANVAHVVAALEGNAHFISKIAGDPEGLTFKKHMEDNGVSCHFPPVSPADLGSPQVPTLITPDGERTFASYDGVSSTFSADDYDFDLISRSDYLFLDGYCFRSPATGGGFIKAAQATTGKTILNLGDLSILEDNQKAIYDLLPFCDGLICNDSEAKMLFEATLIQDILNRMMSRFSVGAITHGAEGAYVFANGQSTHIPAEDISTLATVDTNGAGDHFSGGFIYALMKGYDIKSAGRLGSLCAKDCLSHVGGRPLGGHGSLKHLADLAKT